MNELSTARFQRSIFEIHGAEATLLSCEHVHEHLKREPGWEGDVLVFELEGHPETNLCYAWEVEGRVTAVLHVAGFVNSPAKAVRASILAEYDFGFDLL